MSEYVCECVFVLVYVCVQYESLKCACLNSTFALGAINEHIKNKILYNKNRRFITAKQSY